MHVLVLRLIDGANAFRGGRGIVVRAVRDLAVCLHSSGKSQEGWRNSHGVLT